MKISIIIPTINRHEMLSNLLKDLIDQFNDKFEIIIIDQSEYMNNSKLLNKNFINYIFKPEIKNLSDAKNFGVIHAQGEYIGFLDDDIRLSEYFVDRLFKSISNLNPFVISGVEDEAYNNSLFIYSIKKLFYTGIFSDDRILYINKKYDDYIITNKIFGGCSFFKKEIFNKISFRKNSPFFINEDTDFSLLVKKITIEKFYIDTNLKYTHLSSTKKFNQEDIDSDKIIKKIIQNIVTTKLLYKFHKKNILDFFSLIWLLVGYLFVSIYLSLKYKNLRYLNASLSSIVSKKL